MSQEKNRERTLSVAQERYVECIADAESNHGHAHVSLLADTLGVSKPSVVQMITRLAELGIARRRDKEVTLTPLGEKLAGELHGRHAILQDLMEGLLKMDAKAADEEACRLEHVVSADFMRSVRAYMKRRKD